MKNNINFKLPSTLIIFILLVLGNSNTTLAEQTWNRADFGTKSLTGNTMGKIPTRTETQKISTTSGISSRIEKTSPKTETRMQSTNFGIDSRIEKTPPKTETNIKSISSEINPRTENFINSPESTFKKSTSYVTNNITNLGNQLSKFTELWNKKPQEAAHAQTNQNMRKAQSKKITLTSTSTKIPLNKKERNLLNSGQSSNVFQNLSLLSEALDIIGVKINTVTSIRGDIYYPDGSLAQKNAVIVTEDQIKNGLNNPKLNGKIIIVKQIEIQKSYY